MRSFLVASTLFCAASLAQNTYSAKEKKEKDDDRWIWGYVDVDGNKNNNKLSDLFLILQGNKNEREVVYVTIENRNENQENTSTTKATFNKSPCEYYNPPKPSFSAPGRKISDEKCEEYKWDKKVQEEAMRRDIECWAEVNKGRPPPPAAVGGHPTLLGEFPHMGAIGWKAAFEGYLFKCGSTLISPKFVLTAAHCSKASSLDSSLADVVPKIVRLSDKNIFRADDNGVYLSTDMNITRIIVHPNFKPPKKYFDIALMELQFEVTFTWLMQPACLWTKTELEELGDDATLTGWGVLHSGSYQISPELQAAVVNIINASFCDQLLYSSRNRNWWGLNEHQLCAGILAGGVDACKGDSGGPLQVKQHISGSQNKIVYHVIGVTSFGIGCALPNHPGIYTRVSSFIDWIEGYVWPKV